MTFQLNLEQLRKQAKERVRERQAAGQDANLADLQFELARELGFTSWPKLKAYVERLSSISRHTLRLQGGVMSADDAARFAAHPWLPDALALRRWDDLAKVKGKPTRSLADWAPAIRRYVP